MNVLVLGCGPAGLLAAHAAQLAGHSVDVVSDKKKSILGGAQYLHHPIPGLTPDEPQGSLSVLAMGTKEGYARKVYDDPKAEVSWDHYVAERGRTYLDGEHIPIWDIVGLYDQLWDEWEGEVSQDVITHPHDLFSVVRTYDKVVSTIPANVLCLEPERHDFVSQRIFVIPKFPFHHREGRDFIVYNGDMHDSWYRASHIFGRGMIEFSEHSWYVPEDDDGMWVRKPLYTSCDCWSTEVLKVGRYGKWHKGDLVTDAFDEVFARLSVRDSGRV